MDINRIEVTIAELIEGYEEKGADGIEGVVAFGGKLDVRPAYQREYIYGIKDRDEVIRSVMKGYPVNVMYWAKVGDDHYELMDGQQRTISICRYAAAKDERNKKPYEQCFSVDDLYYFNHPSDRKDDFLKYTLDIYICDGLPSEIHAWFTVINIAGKVLSAQELRNTSYTGPWLSDAKIYFSKPNCRAYGMAKDYMKGSPIRQQYLETAIKWISDRDGLESIEAYMGKHQKDENANEICIYFRRVIEWVQTIFPVKLKNIMDDVEWGYLYNDFKDASLDPDELEQKISGLLLDKDVSNKSGVYAYVLTHNEKYLSIRAFDEADKIEAYERQNGICAVCGKRFNYEEMHADHIKPWSKGGKTIAENCKMLCADCNRKKSNI